MNWARVFPAISINRHAKAARNPLWDLKKKLLSEHEDIGRLGDDQLQKRKQQEIIQSFVCREGWDF